MDVPFPGRAPCHRRPPEGRNLESLSGVHYRVLEPGPAPGLKNVEDLMSRYWIAGVALLIAAGLLLGNVLKADAGPGGPGLLAKPAAPATKVIGKMPAWKLTDVQGKPLSSADLKGKVLLIDFWASWCPPCKKEIPGFIELQKQYGSKGLAVVGFSFDETPEDHASFVKAQKFNYPSLFAATPAGEKVVAEFEKVIGKIEGIPTTLVVDRQGNIVFSHVGYAPKEEFEKVLVPLLK